MKTVAIIGNHRISYAQRMSKIHKVLLFVDYRADLDNVCMTKELTVINCSYVTVQILLTNYKPDLVIGSKDDLFIPTKQGSME